MKKKYQVPEIEIVSLISEEAVAGDLMDGITGTSDVPDDYEWDN